ncbi:adenylyl-sulfate kinase [Cytobacillus kochii]|uniref:adenylyl-sulfate kinase n=1 Tax=Cytobacillus kochii TaxID=859143 RepID=UPI001CD31BA6|nr:adenylyl-sulfate kinase [Cytobacillus kochii]MCA1028618.1 adenylyl-sulfate kinase [Cytobacillus kochii]
MKRLLRFITCGSVDDGKSTLIGHMLYKAKLLYTDEEKALRLDSKVGNNAGKIDYSLLLDGLIAEREQGITIDVAYRYFTTEKRSFIVADTPGHEEYTHNMAVGASYADLAIILVDATKGVVTQTKRHLRICSLMGIENLVLVVNKMDLIEFDQNKFTKITQDFMKEIYNFNLENLQAIPISATEGDNIIHRSKNTLWYDGPSLLQYIETVDIKLDYQQDNFIMPVQRVSRPNHTFRGYQGQVEAGNISLGEEVISLPNNERAKIKHILVTNKEENSASVGNPVTIQLDREVDVSRGSVLTTSENLYISDMFTGTIFWMDSNNFTPNSSYLIKVGTKIIPAKITSIKHKIDINTGNRLLVNEIMKNELVECNILLSEKIVFYSFKKNKSLGSFILIDRLTNLTSACGVISQSINKSSNVYWGDTFISRETRASQKGQTPLTLWFTGLSGSGKTTLANEVDKRLVTLGYHTMILDGDNIRHGLSKDLGFSRTDRIENIRRISEVANLMNDSGLITIIATISPYENDRENARKIIGEGFIEIYLNTSLEECEKRDVKGLYKKARNGKISNFTGISSPYQEPKKPEIKLDTSKYSIEEATNIIVKKIIKFELNQ